MTTKTTTLTITLTVFLFVILAPDTFGQTGLLNVNRYASYFLDTTGNVTRIDRKYTRAISDEDYDKIALLGGDNTRIDTSLEITLMSISLAVVQIRPAEANAMLPANNPKLADTKLGAAVFQEMQVLRFLGDTAAVSRYEAMLRFITGRGNATRAEVETFYHNGIRSLVSEIVDEEFRGLALPATIITYIKTCLSNFYLTPNQTTYNNVLRVYLALQSNIARLIQVHNMSLGLANFAREQGMNDAYQQNINSAREAREVAEFHLRALGTTFENARESYKAPYFDTIRANDSVLNALSPALYERINRDYNSR